MADEKEEGTFENVKHGDSFLDMMSFISKSLTTNSEPIFQKRTFVPQAKVWVSTVSWGHPIGAGRCAETMVFAGTEDEFEAGVDIDFENLGFTTDERELTAAHEHMVRRWSLEEYPEFVKCPKCGHDCGPDDIHGCDTLRCPECGHVWAPIEEG